MHELCYSNLRSILHWLAMKKQDPIQEVLQVS